MEEEAEEEEDEEGETKAEMEEAEEEERRRRRVRLSILQKLPRVTGPFVNEIESPVTAVPRRRNMHSLTESPRLT